MRANGGNGGGTSGTFLAGAGGGGAGGSILMFSADRFLLAARLPQQKVVEGLRMEAMAGTVVKVGPGSPMGTESPQE